VFTSHWIRTINKHVGDAIDAFDLVHIALVRPRDER
jgi:hypothetical protein